MPGPTIDNSAFRRILSRNVALPLGMSIVSAVVFVGIIAYLINPGVGNFCDYDNAEVAAAYRATRSASASEEELAAAHHELQELIFADAPHAAFAQLPIYEAYSDDVTGLYSTDGQGPWLADVKKS